MKTLSLGKLPASILDDLLKEIKITDPALIIPPGSGLDAAGLKLEKNLYAFATDPITFATKNIGTYAVAVNVNDVACLGCKPRFFACNLLLPENTTETQLKHIWQDLIAALDRFNIQIIGGHTEVTQCVNLPVIVGQMLGEAIGNNLLSPVNAAVGDKILLYQAISIEGTALIAQELKSKIQPHFSSAEIAEMSALLENPGICIWPFVKELLPNPAIIGLHDTTEGGIATALHEIADAAHLGLEIFYEKIPILDSTRKLSEILALNPLGLLASGSLLVICKAQVSDAIIKKFGKEKIVEIGCFTEGNSRILVKQHASENLPRFSQDEYLRILN